MASNDLITSGVPLQVCDALPGKRRGHIVGEAMLTFGGRGVAILSALAVSVLTARVLGPSGKGDYFLIITFAAVVTQLSNLGLQPSNTYLVATAPQYYDKLVANTICISAVMGGIASLLGTVFVSTTHMLAFPAIAVLLLLVGLIPASLFFSTGGGLFIGCGAITTYNLAQVVAYGLLATAIGLAAYTHAHLAGFLILTILSWSVTSVFVFSRLRRRGIPITFSKDVFLLGWKYSAKAYITTLVGLLVLRSNVLLLKMLCGSSQVGYFSIAAQLMDGLVVLPISVATVLFPRLVIETEAAWSVTRKALLAVAGIMLGVCVMAVFLAGPFVRIMYGATFNPAVPIVLAMLPAVFCLGLVSVLSQFLSAQGFPRHQVLAWIAMLSFHLVLNSVLIRRFEMLGAAVGTSITYALLFMLLLLVASKVRNRAAQLTIRVQP